ncbi:hypothetical protein EIP91_006798 [Steccherinum ochraceum]|uniref:YABBY protein C-terminal domain-containing protein n=1 Tax=Steccherinum ochraceum TaxID=92696 RepID=A0A4R0R5B8_9APHY|nr:hypothetical protein EIP91_006798 [Steccherinum ochraceum]
MAPPAKNASDAPKKTKSGKKGGGGKKKLTPFNKFMQTEIARLKEEKPEIPHKERFKMVVDNWNKKKEADAKAA